MKSMELYLPEPAATLALGAALGRLLQPGQTVCLVGDLGTGKTLLTQGAAAALGVDRDRVTSPSFQLLNVYQGRQGLAVGHFDLYRLEREEELEAIGFGEYLESGPICFIEWADRFPQAWPAEYLTVELSRAGSGRQARLRAQGAAYEELLQALAEEVAACGC